MTDQAASQAAQTSGANNKLDPKNKAAQTAKTQTPSGKSSETELATGAASQTTTDARVETPTIGANEAKPVLPNPLHVATAPVSQEKPTTDTAAAPQPTTLLAAANPDTVTARLQVAPQRSDSDTVSTLDKLGMTIAARSAEGLHHFDIRLDPADLGRVQVRLTVDDSGQAQATIVADKQQTLDMLQRDSSSLNRALQDAGLSLSNNGLNFSLREQQQQHNEASGQSRRRALSAAAVLSTEASQSRSSQGSYAPNSVRLDIRV
jgi:chemotaxis protein MotD